MDIELVWDEPVSAELEAEVVRSIREELLSGSGALSRAENLVFHSVQLSPDIDGPEVAVWGVTGDHRFHCQYSPHFTGMKFEIDDIPGMREKLKAAGRKFPDEEEDV